MPRRRAAAATARSSLVPRIALPPVCGPAGDPIAEVIFDELQKALRDLDAPHVAEVARHVAFIDEVGECGLE